MTDRRSLMLTLAFIVLAGLGAVAAVNAAQSGVPPTELPIRFAARAQAQGTIGTGSAARVEMTITDWSTDADRDALLGVLVQEGPEAMKKALQDKPEVGRVRIGGSTSYPLQFAREFALDDGRRMIRIVTDRRIGAFEALVNTRISEYAFTLIELIVDESYEGEGAAAIGVEIVVDPENRTFRLQNYDTAPVRLSSVRPIEIR